MDRFGSYFEGRNVRTCFRREVKEGAQVSGTDVQWRAAFIGMGKIARTHAGTGLAVSCGTPLCRHQIEG